MNKTEKLYIDALEKANHNLHNEIKELRDAIAEYEDDCNDLKDLLHEKDDEVESLKYENENLKRHIERFNVIMDNLNGGYYEEDEFIFENKGYC